jgi:hypothetical protein
MRSSRAAATLPHRDGGIIARWSTTVLKTLMHHTVSVETNMQRLSLFEDL